LDYLKNIAKSGDMAVLQLTPRVADPRTLVWLGDPLTKFPILVRGVAHPTKFSQITFESRIFIEN